MEKERWPKNPWSILIRSWFPCLNDWKQSRWRSLSTMGCSCRWRSHSPFDKTRILLLQEWCLHSKSKVLIPCHWGIVLISSNIVYLATITTRNRRRTTRAYLLLQAQTMAVGTEFIFYMVELARLMVVFLKFRKSGKNQEKSWERTGRPVVEHPLAKTLRRWLSRIQFILLQVDRLQLTVVYHLKWPVFAMCNKQQLWLQSELTMTR